MSEATRKHDQRSEKPGIVRDLKQLIDTGQKFSTIYADPPWRYANISSRGAAENHYRTMSVEQICEEPVEEICEPNAHLHLWTTNAFLKDAFDVIQAWGFEYKSCLVWLKPQLGMGNYWRVSHEFMLLGVRGRLPFNDNTCRSWLIHPRTIHSKKPFAVRQLIERVSPGLYLEMYGREEIPRSPWTIYGNQVERRLFREREIEAICETAKGKTMAKTTETGVIHADEAYSKKMVLQRLMISQKFWDKMLDEGLPYTTIGHTRWVRGADLLEHLKRKAERKHE